MTAVPEVRVGDPIYAKLTYTNNTLAEGTPVSIVVVLGYDVRHYDWGVTMRLVVFDHKGERYLCGTYVIDACPAPGESKTITIPTVVVRKARHWTVYGASGGVAFERDVRGLYDERFTDRRMVAMLWDDWVKWFTPTEWYYKTITDNLLHITDGDSNTSGNNLISLEHKTLATEGPSPQNPWGGVTINNTWYEEPEEIPPVGRLHRATLINDETNERWGLDEFPVRLPIGAPVRVIARGVNTSRRTLDLRITVELIDPNDNVRVRRVRVDTVQHEEEISSRTTVPPIQLDLDGVWKIRARLEVNPILGQAQADDELPIEEMWEAIIVGEQPVRWLLPAVVGTIVLIGGIVVVSYKRGR